MRGSAGGGLAASATLFGLSLAVRLGAWLAAGVDLEPLYDEADYLARAAAWREILVALAAFEAPPAAALDGAYGGGHWPPLHPLLLALALLPAGAGAGAARLAMVVVSALATLLVHRLARRLYGDRAALAAAAIHGLHPSFVAFSHYLWSETTQIFFLLAAVLLALGAPGASGATRRLLRAAAAGATFGLAALAWAGAAVYLPVAALWTGRAFRRRASGTAAAGLMLAAGLAVLAPWHAVLAAREGRLVPLATLGGWNLALGNNPWVPAGAGSSWGDEPSKLRLREALEAAAEGQPGDWRAAAAPFALDHIRQRPAAFVGRALRRLQMLWSPDFFPLRHLFRAVYPPLPQAAAGLVAGTVVASSLAVVALCVLGLTARRPPAAPGAGLAIALAAAGLALPAATVGLSRLHLPLVALLLPAAGRAVAASRRGGLRPIGWGLALAACALSTSALPRVAAHHLQPSGYYAPLLGGLAWPGPPGATFDRIELRGAALAGELAVQIASPGACFPGGSRALDSRLPGRVRLDVAATDPVPLALRLAVDDGSAVEVAPLRRDGWRRWRPAGPRGLEARWEGASSPALFAAASDPAATDPCPPGTLE